MLPLQMSSGRWGRPDPSPPQPGLVGHGLPPRSFLVFTLGTKKWSSLRAEQSYFVCPLGSHFAESWAVSWACTGSLLEFLPLPEEPVPASVLLCAAVGEAHLQRKPQAEAPPSLGPVGVFSFSFSPFILTSLAFNVIKIVETVGFRRVCSPGGSAGPLGSC